MPDAENNGPGSWFRGRHPSEGEAVPSTCHAGPKDKKCRNGDVGGTSAQDGPLLPGQVRTAKQLLTRILSPYG